MHKRFSGILVVLLICFLALSGNFVAFAQTTTWETRTITFPVAGTVTFGDDFGDPRASGVRTHEGNDLMGSKMMPLVAAVDGTVRRVVYPEGSYGYSVVLEDKDGYTYHYLHVNNDMPGTDDGKGGGMNAYAVDIDSGRKVIAGQLVGYMGDSGNAEATRAHLHFEIHRPDRTVINPYASLKAATRIKTPITPHPKQPDELLPFGEFNGGGFIAAGNADADSDSELAIAAGPGGGPHVKIINQDGTEVGNIFAYDSTFRGGVDIALADIDGDKIAELITVPFSRGGPHVKIFKIDGTLMGGFMAYDGKFQGGVNLAATDVDNDGKAEIITSPGKGGGPHVRIFKPDGTEVKGFFAYDPSFSGGIDIAASSTSGGNVTIATSPLLGGGPHIKTFNAQGVMQSEFLAYDAGHRSGVRLTLGNITGRSGVEVVTVPLLGGSHTRVFSANGEPQESEFAFEEWWTGSWDVTVGGNEVFAVNGPNTKRRTSVREVDMDDQRRNFGF